MIHFEIECQTPSSQKWKTPIDGLHIVLFESEVLHRVIAKLTLLLVMGARGNVVNSSQLHYYLPKFTIFGKYVRLSVCYLPKFTILASMFVCPFVCPFCQA